MTPLMIGKRLINHMRTVITDEYRTVPAVPNHMNIHRTEHPVPSKLIYSLGPKVIKDLRLRSGYTVAVEQISKGGESHRHSWSAFDRRKAALLVYLGAKPTELGYTDPRNNEFHYREITPGETFILSTHHTFHYNNVAGEDLAIYLNLNAHLNWQDTVRYWQHTW